MLFAEFVKTLRKEALAKYAPMGVELSSPIQEFLYAEAPNLKFRGLQAVSKWTGSEFRGAVFPHVDEYEDKKVFIQLGILLYGGNSDYNTTWYRENDAYIYYVDRGERDTQTKLLHTGGINWLILNPRKIHGLHMCRASRYTIVSRFVCAATKVKA